MAASGLIVAAIFTTMSRGALVALAVMLFVFIRRIGVNFRIMVAAGLIMVSMLFVSDKLIARIVTPYNRWARLTLDLASGSGGTETRRALRRGDG